MAIRAFKFEDRDSGWQLAETSFGELNLLVGISGVGKTRILEALHDVRQAARSARGISSCSWELTLEAGGACYTWAAETRVDCAGYLPRSEVGESGTESDARFVRETILRDGKDLVGRATDRFVFQGRELPRLPNWQGAIELLQSEDAIRPLHQALRRWLFASRPSPQTTMADLRRAEDARRQYPTVEALGNASALPSLIKAYVLQKDHPELFAAITEQYTDIFPMVSSLRIDRCRSFDWRPRMSPDFLDQFLTVGLRERGVSRWITQDLSTGMMKTLAYLTELALAPSGSVFIVDELENSLGINCLPEIADHFLAKNRDIQIILTTHHPQVINMMPPEYWKLVTRRGSLVQVLDGGSIPALETASPLEKFTQLINLSMYEEGVARQSSCKVDPIGWTNFGEK